MGIGTKNPSYKLDVCGTIRAREAIIDLLGVCPDYVFEKDYNLITIQELKEYISIHKHLPEVPSASEIKQNGINVAELNMILLKKIEEITLYIIEQQEKIDELLLLVE